MDAIRWRQRLLHLSLVGGTDVREFTLQLMASTFTKTGGAVPALSEVFGGRIYGGLVMVSAVLVGVAARLLRHGVRSTTRGLRGTLGR